MTTYYVSSVDGSNSDDGSSWANAVATLEYAVETLAASGGPHTILVDSAHSESLGGATTITAAQDLQIISVNRSGSDAPLAGAVIGSQVTNYALTITGATKVYIYGLHLKNGSSTESSQTISVMPSAGGHFELENVLVTLAGNSNSTLTLGSGGSTTRSYIAIRGLDLTVGNAAHVVYLNSFGEISGMTIAGTDQTYGFWPTGSAHGTNWRIEASDLTNITGTLVRNNVSTGTAEITFANCSLASGVTIYEAQTGALNKGGRTVYLFNCAAGDLHYAFGHYDPFGSTAAQTTIYANDGAKYDGSAGVAWAITTTANCSFYTPYVSPWFSQYAEAGTVTPTVEIVRDGSATAYQDDEVWGEFSYQGTSGSTKATIVSDRMALLGTPANQTTGDLGAGDWTGENATAWFGKLSPGSITINEIGHLSARIMVGEPEITVYADPTIRTT